MPFNQAKPNQTDINQFTSDFQKYIPLVLLEDLVRINYWSQTLISFLHYISVIQNYYTYIEKH